MFICSVCGIQISDKSNYNKHIQSHSDVFCYKCMQYIFKYWYLVMDLGPLHMKSREIL